MDRVRRISPMSARSSSSGTTSATRDSEALGTTRSRRLTRHSRQSPAASRASSTSPTATSSSTRPWSTTSSLSKGRWPSCPPNRREWSASRRSPSPRRQPRGRASRSIASSSTSPTRSTSLYQAVSGTEEVQNIYKQFKPDFFDLIVVDECHRGSAAEESAWRAILEYFGQPIYEYSLPARHRGWIPRSLQGPADNPRPGLRVEADGRTEGRERGRDRGPRRTDAPGPRQRERRPRRQEPEVRDEDHRG
jgi:hypothetical protein